MKPLALRLVVILLLIAAILWGVLNFSQLKQSLDEFLAWTQRFGFWGGVAFVGVYVLATVLFIPGSVLTLAAGFTYGPLWGTLIVSAGSVVGAALAFLLGRTLLRGFIEDKVAGNEKFAAIDKAVGNEGFKIVLLTRLSPIFPFNLLNYSFGLTGVRFGPYVLASWIGMLPGTFMYVYLGSAVKNLTAILTGDVEGGLAQKVLFGIGLVATVAVTVLVTRVARKALQDAVPAEKRASPS